MSNIEIKDLSLFYGSFQALKNINLSIKSKQITAFIGPSGCGKSTTLKCLNRLNDLVSNCQINGKIMIDEQDIYERKVNVNDLRKKVGMVFQAPNPFAMSIYDNIAYGPRNHGIKDSKQLDAIVEKALKQAALWLIRDCS